MENSKMLDLECPICLNRSSIRSLSTGWSCDNCAYVWRTAPWENTDPIKHFENASYTTQEPPAVQNLHITLFKAFEQLASATVKSKNKRMLDFGCAYGTCMEVFKKKGWEVFGIEITTRSQKILTEKKLRWASTLQESGLEDGSVDTIIMADCIYYLLDPVQTLSQLQKYLTPKGILLLRQPTRAGLMRLISKLPGTSTILQLLWYDHVHLFSRHSTIEALAKAGFLRIDILKEHDFERELINQLAHQMLHFFDLITFGYFDLTPSWTVCAKTYPPLNRMLFSLQDERVTLRRIKFSDITDIFTAIQDPEIARWAAPLERAVNQHFLGRMPRYIGKTIRYLWWKLFPPKNRRIFRFGISPTQSKKIVGMAILTRKGPQLEFGEIGFWITKKYWGQGLTTNAMKMVINFGFNYLDLEKIEGWTTEKNVGSQKVMEKCGLMRCGPDYNSGEKSGTVQGGYWFRILKSEYHGKYGKLMPEKIYAE